MENSVKLLMAILPFITIFMTFLFFSKTYLIKAQDNYPYPPPSTLSDSTSIPELVNQPYPPPVNNGNIPITNDPNIKLSASLVADAQSYASIYDVSLNEALYRLNFQDIAENLNAFLIVNEVTTFAGLWIQNQPDYRIIIQFADNEGESIKDITNNSPLSEVVEFRKRDATLDQLRIEQTLVTNIMEQSNIPFRTGINVIDNCVELYVIETNDVIKFLRNINFSLPNHIKLKQAIALGKEVADIYGGLALSTCTSGFSVVDKEGIRGITTAGHCSNTQFYDGIELNFQLGTLPGQEYDIQWHQADHAFDIIGKIYDGLGDRPILNEKFRNNQIVGGFVCKYGKVSGRMCGSIAEIYINGINVRVDIPVFEGDSGGPWFFSDIAYGTTIYQCILSDGTICAIYGPVDQIRDILGLTFAYRIYLPMVIKN